MKQQTTRVLLASMFLFSITVVAEPLGTSFTYQGRLTNAGQPANGGYDLTFTAYDALADGNAIAGPITNSPVTVSNGLFTTTLDFGAVFTGDARWLDIAVRTNGGGAFVPLSPRQPLTPAPYALFASNAGAANNAFGVAAGVVSNLSLAPGAVTTDKIADGTLTAADLSPALVSNTFWRLGGNVGTTPSAQFLGTTDNQPLELRANNQRILRLEPDAANNAPSVIAGSSSNTVGPGVVGAVIAGGGRGTQPNRIFGAWGVIGGGEANVVSNNYDVVSGGLANTASGGMSTVGGGSGNVAQDLPLGRATVAGGMDNRATGSAATVAGGRDNAATNQYATVPGGRNNLAGGSDSLAAGRRAKAQHTGAFVWADSTDADFASTGMNQFLIRAQGGVGIGTNNPQTALHVAGTVTATGFSGSGAGVTGLNASQLASGAVPDARLSANVSLLGGSIESGEITDGTITAADVQANTFWKNTGNTGTTPGTHFLGTTDNQPLELRVNNLRGFWLEPKFNDANRSNIVNVVGGSPANTVGAGVYGATIAGGGAANWFGSGAPNRVFATFGTIGGGSENTIQTNAGHSTVGGGGQNMIQTDAQSSTIGGGRYNMIQSNTLHATIGGGWDNNIQPYAVYVTIGGGRLNKIQTNVWNATIGGGVGNTIWANADSATIGGGAGNAIQTNASHATVGGGTANKATGPGSFIGGGGWDALSVSGNAASGRASVITGGHANTADGDYATLGGGKENTIQTNASYATIAGGYDNDIAADAFASVIAGGWANDIRVNAYFGAIGGGYDNNIADSTDYSVIAGGYRNDIGADAYSGAIGGGFDNNIAASSQYATIPGGRWNSATNYGFAAGNRAKANHQGAFVWADSTEADFASTRNDEFNIRAAGGVRIDTGAAAGIALNAADRSLLTCGWNPFTSGKHSGLGRWGAFMEAHTLALGMPAVGGKTVQVVKYNEDSTYTSLMTVDQGGTVTATAFNPTSDRNAKENFAPVDSREVLEKVAALPISRWNFKADGQTPHIGPMAQDFHAAFGLGADDKHIATVDADGVALAAIQGLNQKVEARSQRSEVRSQLLEEKLQQKDAEITELKQAVAELKQIVQQLIK